MAVLARFATAESQYFTLHHSEKTWKLRKDVSTVTWIRALLSRKAPNIFWGPTFYVVLVYSNTRFIIITSIPLGGGGGGGGRV